MPARAAVALDNPWLKAAVILLLGLFIYAPVFSGGWLMDDDQELTDNPAVQSLAGLPKIWRGEAGPDYLPLKTTVQWALWQAFGNHPASFHLASIALHLGSALLFWRLLARLGMGHAWLGGLLFAVHPVCVESVAWVSELKNTLSLAALLAVMLAWVSFEERGRGRDYAGALGWFVAALLCKSAVVMWPVVMLLYAWWKRGGVNRRDVLASAPFFAVALAAGVLTVWMHGARAIRTEVYPLGGVASHVALAGMDIAFYLWKIVLPVGLLPMYPQWRIDPPSAVEFLPWAALAALFGWLWMKRRVSWGRATWFGLGFFLVNLLPVLGFFKMSFMRISWVSDHFVYLPSLGIIGLAAAGLGALYDRMGEGMRPRLRVAGWLGLGALVMASRVHADVYADLETMSRYTLASNPDAWTAHQLWSVAAHAKRDDDTALAQAEAAVRLRPGVMETQNSLGLALAAKGRFPEAINHLEEAARLDPHSWAVHVNLAKSLLQAGRYEQALPVYQWLLQQTPRDPALHSNLGACLFSLGRMDGAVDQFHQALVLDPSLDSVRENLALALKQQSGNAGSSPGTTP